MLGLMGFSGSLPLYVIHRYNIFVFIDRANKDACLLALAYAYNALSGCFSLVSIIKFCCSRDNSRKDEGSRRNVVFVTG